MKHQIQLIRPQQWLKNFFIFAPLFFSGNLLDFDKLCYCAVAFLAFSLNASSIYIINDYRDIENDKLHPTKKNASACCRNCFKRNCHRHVLLFVHSIFYSRIWR